ncbi:Lipase_GDSL domain-containing protein [Psidium guajava]|nr:Lipase_GDSL domain-containing protein [Psidium guajava]
MLVLSILILKCTNSRNISSSESVTDFHTKAMLDHGFDADQFPRNSQSDTHWFFWDRTDGARDYDAAIPLQARPVRRNDKESADQTRPVRYLRVNVGI